MIHNSLLSAALISSGLALAVPASAASDPAKKQETAQAVPSIKDDPRKFCIDTDSSASRIPLRVCRTRAEWAVEGVDPLALMNQKR